MYSNVISIFIGNNFRHFFLYTFKIVIILIFFYNIIPNWFTEYDWDKSKYTQDCFKKILEFKFEFNLNSF